MAENEVAHAGIGADLVFHGLSSLKEANHGLEQLYHNADKIHNITSNITTRIMNKGEISHFQDQLDKIRHGVHTDIDVNSNGVSKLSQIRQEMTDTQHSANELKHSLDINTHTVGNSGVDNLNKSVQKLTGSLHGLKDSGGDSFHRLGSSATGAKSKVSSLGDAGHRLRDVFAGSALGQAASNGLSQLRTGAESAIKSGIQLVSVGRDTSKAWHNVGLNNGQANQMTEQMDEIRDKAGMDEQSINMMQKSFYSLTGSAPRARSLTNELVSFGKATGESDQQISRMGKTLPRMLSTGKVSGQMFNRTFRQSPALINAIAKASGHTTGQFRQLASNGKITSQQLEQYMEKAAKGSGNAWKQYATTFQGQMQMIKGTWTTAKENFAKPFVSNLTKAINQTTKDSGGIAKVQKSVQGLSDSLGKKVGNFAGKAIGFIVKNQKPLIGIGTSLFKIIGAIGSGVWKEFSSVLTGITGGTNKSGKSLNNFNKSLSRVASHTKQFQKLGKVLVNLWAINKVNKFNKSVLTAFHSLTKFTFVKSLQTKLRGLNKNWQNNTGLLHRVTTGFSRMTRAARRTGSPLRAIATHGFNKIRTSTRSFGRGAQLAFLKAQRSTKRYNRALTQGTMAQRVMRIGILPLKLGFNGLKLSAKGFGTVLRQMPIVGWIQIAIDGITELYMHSAKFRHLVNPLLRFTGKAIGWIGDKIADVINGVIKWGRSFLHPVKSVKHFFSIFHHGQSSDAHAAEISHKQIDKYRNNSSKKFRAYMSKNGKIYRSYHKGTTRISKATYTQREQLRSRYYRKYESSLRKYERNYRRYESKRSSLSRKYGKLRAMYSEKSLKQVTNRFKGLRSTITRYTKDMYRDTQHWFKRLGTGAIRQYRDIYRNVRKYLRMSNRESVKDFKALANNSRRYLDGAVNKYVRELRYRSKQQRYYDNQLLKQAKRTNQAMYKIPLGWISKETHMLVSNWKSQRGSFITHNERMTKAERTHLDTMTNHLDEFRDNFKSLMSKLEDSIYNKWSKFWDDMRDKAGSGMNSVQSPLNQGAEHLNGFVRAFGETSSPISEMPSVSYATGTGALGNIRRPINRLTSAVLNDGHDSPETGNQETIIHADGQMEKPIGTNVHEMLEPGAEVLNATETKFMDALNSFNPEVHLANGTVHLATGTGIFGDIINKFSSWIKDALEGNNNSNAYASIEGSAKGQGKERLLHILQGVLGKSEQVLSGFMGNAPSGFKGIFDNITKGMYGMASSQIDSWWKALMNLTNQTLNQGGSSSQFLNFAEKFGQGKKYVWGGTGSGGGYDCSGFVQAVLRHFGVNAPRTSGPQINAFPHISRSQAQPGDLVGNSGHIGIVADKGAHNYYSMFNPSVGAKLYPLDSAHWDGNPSMTFARVPKLEKEQNQNNNGPSFKGATKGLMSFVKQQESPMFKWIEKNLAPLLNPDPGGGPGVAKWRPIIKQAADKMHVNLSDSGLNKILSNIQHESNGDEKVQNNWDSNAKAGDPSVGLVQFIKSTFDHYAVSGHDNIRSGYDQLLALFNDSSWYSDIAPGGGWGPTGSRRMATGGHIKAGEMATVGEEGAELFKPDVSGTVIPHNDSHHIINNNQKPIDVHNTINVHVGNGSKSTAKEAAKGTEYGFDKTFKLFIEKMDRQIGNKNEEGFVY